MLTLDTPRLLVTACPAPVARAVYTSRRQAETMLGWRVHPEWPGDDVRAYLPHYATRLENDPDLLGWGIWLVIHRADQMIIGDAGFKGKPDTAGSVDIGYGTVEAYRRQGYTTEAAAALRDWAFAQPGVRRLTGDCLPENKASARILEKLGMQPLGLSDDGLLLFELHQQAAQR